MQMNLFDYSLDNEEKCHQSNQYMKVLREKADFYGYEDCSISELFSLVLGEADQGTVQSLSIIPIRELMTMRKSDFIEVKGVTEEESEKLEAAVTLTKKLFNQSIQKEYKISSPDDAFEYEGFKSMIYETQEIFKAIYLDTKNQVISEKVIFKGSLNTSIAHPREIFHEAVKKSAASVIVCHNHPSGMQGPSQEDIDVSKRVKEAGDYLGIHLIDSLIVGREGLCSLKEKGYLNK